MKTRSKKTAEIAQDCRGNSLNHGRKTEAEHRLLPFSTQSEFEELETTIKVENYIETDGDHVANIVKSELLEFHSNQSHDSQEIFYQNDVNTVLLEKIPKTETETEILGDDDDEAQFSSCEVDDPFNNDTFRDSDLNPDPDPQLDPFADVDCDPSFSEIPKFSNVGETKKSAKINPFPFKCQFCTCAFALREPLVAHLASHPEVNTTDQEDLKRRPYRCQECPFTFKHYSVYTSHMVLHKNELAFKCPMSNCEKAFNNKGGLKNHLRHGHSKEKPFKCPEPNCGKTFKTKAQVRDHVICHSGDTPFKCTHPDCNQAFKSKDRRRRHLLLHSEAHRLKHKAEQIYKCSERGCYAAYKHSENLRTHVKQKHKQ